MEKKICYNPKMEFQGSCTGGQGESEAVPAKLEVWNHGNIPTRDPHEQGISVPMLGGVLFCSKVNSAMQCKDGGPCTFPKNVEELEYDATVVETPYVPPFELPSWYRRD